MPSCKVLHWNVDDAKVKGKVTVHTMNAYGGVEFQFRSLLTLALDYFHIGGCVCRHIVYM
jgi:hypothetical protein